MSMKTNELRLRIYGSDGVEIRVGDLVKTTTSTNIGWRGGFYTRVKVHQGGIYPFSHFSYALTVKVDKLPEGVLPMTRRDENEKRELPEAWYTPSDEHFGEDGDTEENQRNWKLESMQFEGRGFYRVQEIEVERQFAAEPNLFTQPA